MNVLSLFSGIGGLDLGLERAGMTVVGQVEIDPWCRKVLEKHWPEVPRHDDVRTAAAWWGNRGAVDVVCGGFPCQPVSDAGKKLAQDDERWLWPLFADVVRALRPRYVLVENSEALIRRGMGDVLGDLAACGYDAEWDCIPAAAIGAVHIRDRVWIVAYPDRGRREGIRLAEPARQQSSPRHQPDRRGEVRQLVDPPPHMADAGSPQGRIWPRWRRELAQGGRGPRYADWWAAEPRVGRVAHGIPGRVDRLRGLGNAVVPQVAEHIGRMIMEAA